MEIQLLSRRSLAALAVFLAPLGLAQTADMHWVPTWGASPQQPAAARPAAAAAPAAAAPARPARVTGVFNNQTIRMIAHTSIGGRRVRVQLSNAYGTVPVTLGPVHVAIRSKDSTIAAGSDRPLMFNGKPTVSIPIATSMMSDPVDLDVPQLGDLAISVFVPTDSGPATLHSVGLHTTYVATGDVTGQESLADALTSQSFYFLSSVEVLAPADAAAIVTLGDSITDGTRSTPNTDSAWPNFLAQRLLANPPTARIAVVNEGISANRVLRDGMGVSALARFERDVLAHPNVKWMTFLEGINDIGSGLGAAFVFTPRPTAADDPTPEELIGAYRQIIDRAHNHGIKILGGTLTPFEGAGYYTERGDVIRQAVNQWVRTSNAFDAVLDFDALVRDPQNPKHVKAEFDSSDHLHPNDVGYKAMAGLVDLSMFAAKPAAAPAAQKKR